MVPYWSPAKARTLLAASSQAIGTYILYRKSLGRTVETISRVTLTRIFQATHKVHNISIQPVWINAFPSHFNPTMYGNNSGNTNNSNASSSLTAWHPLQTTSSYDLWELPHPSRAMAFDEEDQLPLNQNQSSEEHHNQAIFDFENQFISPLMASWSFSSPRNQEHTANRQRLGSTSSTSTTRTTQSHGEQSHHKKQALGDATNTAPVLRASRSRFL